MVRYLNPGGHNWAKPNLDGYGISFIVVAVTYTLLFLAGCVFVWLHRHLPVIRMRKINLALASILVLHVYQFMVFMVYPLNGAFPCGVEFWIMSVYLPIGIGLFQAQNQQLLIVSQEQDEMKHLSAPYKPLHGNLGKANGVGTPSYWLFRFKLWWSGATMQGKYEAFILAGIVVQLRHRWRGTIARSMSSRMGMIARHTPLARRSLYRFLRSRKQILGARYVVCIGILWREHAKISVRFVPGLVTMELITLVFPIHQILKHYRETANAKQRELDLAEFDAKRLLKGDATSMTTGSTGSKGKMSTMDSLDQCLKKGAVELQAYASKVEFNGENILFLNRVMHFLGEWKFVFSSGGIDAIAARRLMFKAALNIYLGSVQEKVSPYPINIESLLYKRLETTFGEAVDLLRGHNGRTASLTSSHATPWDELDETTAMKGAESYQMKATTRKSSDNESREAIVTTRQLHDLDDPLADYMVPAEFNSHVFDAAFKSVKFMTYDTPALDIAIDS
ncbi:uncharacterized protein KY384_006440 [Bacidia gigantensis]|uniref:uncharacterized protein n=1 Tax=Bacidia gigantensis TaxID=2732470 RepID=UPI001D055542|nr:uncharacterized protein KY384_006440 [Bacidia gigantensis]KAG8528753.1 hypothetical protein KY384_006440 [Bacidia gigantensis]